MTGTALARGRSVAHFGDCSVQIGPVPIASLVLFLLAVVSIPIASADPIGTQWPQPGGKGTPVVITYSYSNLFDGAFLLLTPAQLRAATQEALGLWARFAPLIFVERPDSGPAPSDTVYADGNTPQIRIGHHETTDWAHAYYPGTGGGLPGDIHLSTGAPWSLTDGAGWNYLEVITHELGHALGLGHELGGQAIMNPFFPLAYSGLGSAYLLPADIADIRAVYGAGSGRVQPLAPVPEPGTLVLAATGLALLLRRIRPRYSRR